MKTFRIILLGSALALLVRVNGTALACAACYGKSDSAMAKGMNAGILALLGVIGAVLCGAATFFVYLARRSSAMAKCNEELKH